MRHLRIFDEFNTTAGLINDIFQDISDDYPLMVSVHDFTGNKKHGINDYRVGIYNISYVDENTMITSRGDESDIIELIFQLLEKCQKMIELKCTYDKFVFSKLSGEQIVWNISDGLENISSFLKSNEYAIDYIIIGLSHYD